MKAIISDIHGNLEALQAVLEDAARHKAEEIYCLGDLVGYGPNPRECVDLAMHWKVVLLGDFDHAQLLDPPHLGVIPPRYLLWSRAELDTAVPNGEAAERRQDFLAELPRRHHEGDFLFVHGSPRSPLHEYIFPEDTYTEPKLARLFGLIGRYCFHGHTHIPGIFTEDFKYLTPEEVNHVYRLDGRKTFVNVGSVGQPRDGNCRACYALLDGEGVCFRRVEYDVAATIKKIHDIDDLDDFLGDRLWDGR